MIYQTFIYDVPYYFTMNVNKLTAYENEWLRQVYELFSKVPMDVAPNEDKGNCLEKAMKDFEDFIEEIKDDD